MPNYVISGLTNGFVQEDAKTTESGALKVEGGTGSFAVMEVQGTYGDFSLSAEGEWAYDLDNPSALVQSLGATSMVQERFTVTWTGGEALTGTVDISIHGQNDEAVIEGDRDITLLMASGRMASGRLAIDDSDSGDKLFVSQTAAPGMLGEFTIDTDGAWTYSLFDDVRLLDTAVEEGFLILTADGSGATMTITVSPNLPAATAGDDRLYGTSTDDTINGLGGIDTLSFDGISSSYVFSSASTGFTVKDQSGGTGSDTLTNIERLQFADMNIALDLDGNAGKVAKILATVFGAAEVSNEVYAGIGLSLIDGGMSYEDLTDLAISVTPAKTPEAVVSLLWSNVMGSPPSPADAQPFIDMLNGGMTYGQLGVLAADYAALIGVVDLAALALTGLEYV